MAASQHQRCVYIVDLRSQPTVLTRGYQLRRYAFADRRADGRGSAAITYCRRPHLVPALLVRPLGQDVAARITTSPALTDLLRRSSTSRNAPGHGATALSTVGRRPRGVITFSTFLAWFLWAFFDKTLATVLGMDWLFMTGHI